MMRCGRVEWQLWLYLSAALLVCILSFTWAQEPRAFKSGFYGFSHPRFETDNRVSNRKIPEPDSDKKATHTKRDEVELKLVPGQDAGTAQLKGPRKMLIALDPSDTSQPPDGSTAEARMPHNYIVFSVVGLLVFIYALGCAVIAYQDYLRKIDHTPKSNIIPLEGETDDHNHPYLIKVYTSGCPMSGASGDVTVVLQGDEGTSIPFSLNGARGPPGILTLQTGECNQFLVFTKKSLGFVNTVIVTLFSRGVRAAWSLNTIEVADMEHEVRWQFQWNSYIEAHVYHPTSIILQESPGSGARQLIRNLSLGEHHILLSLFSSFARIGAYTRQMNLAMCCTLMAMIMLTTMLAFHSVTTLDEADKIEVDTSLILYGVGTSLLISMLICLLECIMKNIRTDPLERRLLSKSSGSLDDRIDRYAYSRMRFPRSPNMQHPGGSQGNLKEQHMPGAGTIDWEGNKSAMREMKSHDPDTHGHQDSQQDIPEGSSSFRVNLNSTQSNNKGGCKVVKQESEAMMSSNQSLSDKNQASPARAKSGTSVSRKAIYDELRSNTSPRPVNRNLFNDPQVQHTCLADTREREPRNHLLISTSNESGTRSANHSFAGTTPMVTSICSREISETSGKNTSSCTADDSDQAVLQTHSPEKTNDMKTINVTLISTHTNNECLNLSLQGPSPEKKSASPRKDLKGSCSSKVSIASSSSFCHSHSLDKESHHSKQCLKISSAIDPHVHTPEDTKQAKSAIEVPTRHSEHHDFHIGTCWLHRIRSMLHDSQAELEIVAGSHAKKKADIQSPEKVSSEKVIDRLLKNTGLTKSELLDRLYDERYAKTVMEKMIEKYGYMQLVDVSNECDETESDPDSSKESTMQDAKEYISDSNSEISGGQSDGGSGNNVAQSDEQPDNLKSLQLLPSTSGTELPIHKGTNKPLPIGKAAKYKTQIDITPSIQQTFLKVWDEVKPNIVPADPGASSTCLDTPGMESSVKHTFSNLDRESLRKSSFHSDDDNKLQKFAGTLIGGIVHCASQPFCESNTSVSLLDLQEYTVQFLKGLTFDLVLVPNLGGSISIEDNSSLQNMGSPSRFASEANVKCESKSSLNVVRGSSTPLLPPTGKEKYAKGTTTPLASKLSKSISTIVTQKSSSLLFRKSAEMLATTSDKCESVLNEIARQFDVEVSKTEQNMSPVSKSDPMKKKSISAASSSRQLLDSIHSGRATHVSKDKMVQVARASLQSILSPQMFEKVKKSVEDTKEQQMTLFAEDVVENLYKVVRGKLECLMEEQQENTAGGNEEDDTSTSMHDLFLAADNEVKITVLPTLVEHLLHLLEDEAKSLSDVDVELMMMAFSGQYVDTIITNAVLQTHLGLLHQLKKAQNSCKQQVSKLSPEITFKKHSKDENRSNNNKGWSVMSADDEPKIRLWKKILKMVVDKMHSQLHSLESISDIIDCRIDSSISSKEDPEKTAYRIVESVGIYTILVQVFTQASRILGQVTQEYDDYNLELNDTQAGELADAFLASGSNAEQHLAVVDLVACELLDITLDRACVSVSESLVTKLTEGSLNLIYPEEDKYSPEDVQDACDGLKQKAAEQAEDILDWRHLLETSNLEESFNDTFGKMSPQHTSTPTKNRQVSPQKRENSVIQNGNIKEETQRIQPILKHGHDGYYSSPRDIRCKLCHDDPSHGHTQVSHTDNHPLHHHQSHGPHSPAYLPYGNHLENSPHQSPQRVIQFPGFSEIHAQVTDPLLNNGDKPELIPQNELLELERLVKGEHNKCLPSWISYILYIVLFLIAALALFCCIALGVGMDKPLARQWCILTLASMAVQIFILEPVKVFLWALHIVYCFNRHALI